MEAIGTRAELHVVQRELRALHAFRVRFTRVDMGPNIYTAEVWIDGTHYCDVLQRRGGDYEAYARNKRLIASASRLSMLRELLIRHYAAANPAASRPASLAGS